MSIETRSYNLSLANTLGPLNSTDPAYMRCFFDNIVRMTAKYRVRACLCTSMRTSRPTRTCTHAQFATFELGSVVGYVPVSYTCDCVYDFSDGGGTVSFYVEIFRRLSLHTAVFLAIDVIVIILAAWSLLLNAKAIYQAVEVFLYVRRELRQPLPPPAILALLEARSSGGGGGGDPAADNASTNASVILPQMEDARNIRSWDDVSFADMMAFVNGWAVATVAGDLCFIFSSLALVFAYATHAPPCSAASALLALSARSLNDGAASSRTTTASTRSTCLT